MSFSDGNFGARVLGAAGPSVVQFSTINDLITASQGGLAPGYYEVTTVPDYHPQHPRIITYWDGATFEPQISTGFESRPTLANERFVWDAIEQKWRQKLFVDSPANHMRNLIGQEIIANKINSTLNIATAHIVKEGAWESTLSSTSSAIFFGDGRILDSSQNITLMFAGRYRGKTSASTSVVCIGVGIGATNDFIGIYSEIGSDVNWHGALLGPGPYLVGPAARVADGDVVLLTYNETTKETTIWVNGVKYGPSSIGTLSLTSNRQLGFNGLENSRFGNFDNGFALWSNDLLDDTAAAAWTAWLQDRYSIPVL